MHKYLKATFLSIDSYKIMYRLRILMIFCGINLYLFFSSDVWSQKKAGAPKDNVLKEYFDDARFFYDMEDYKEAVFNYLKIYEKMPDNANINYWIGMCYLNIPGEEPRAIPYLEKAVKRTTTDYDKNSLTETKAPLYAYFYLGNAYLSNNQPDKALEMYKKFRNHPYFAEHYNARMVDDAIEACERARIIFANPIIANFENLGSIINTSSNDYKPVVSSDENTIIYMTSLKFYEAIMMSTKKDGQWTTPVNISAQVGSDGDCEPACLSSDGKELYLIKKAKGNADIYVSTFDSNHWTLMKPLGKNINSSRNETSACLSRDGNTLYFSSDRRGGYGGLDIYKSEKNKNNEWGTPSNLGRMINTEKNETNPYICDDNKTLIFASEGHLNMGGYDIFVSQWANKKWGMPVNMGYPINTTANDLYYFPIGKGEVGYMYLNRDGGKGQFDIYRVSNIVMKYLSDETAQYQDSLKKVVVRDKISNEIVGYIFSIPNDSTNSQKINSSNYLIEK
jgi:tetratricopeptide (TPR) repeat protein